MSSDHYPTLRVGTAYRRALWMITTGMVAAAAFALAWILRPTADSRRDGARDVRPGTESRAGLAAKLGSAEARITELEGENMRCLERKNSTVGLDACLEKQLECERTAKEMAASLAQAETERDGALGEKQSAVARFDELQRRLKESKNANMTKEIDSLKTARYELTAACNKILKERDELKILNGKLCAECGAKCAKTCPR